MFIETENPNQVFDGAKRKLPGLLMVAVGIFIINLLILLVISFSPRLLASHAAPKTAIVEDATKMSPFTEVASTPAPPKVRGALRIRPVLVEPEPLEPVTATIPADNLQ